MASIFDYGFVSEIERSISRCECTSNYKSEPNEKCRICRGSGRTTICAKCRRSYPFHNGYTPLVCVDCDPLAYRNPPVGLKSGVDDDE